RAWSVGPLRGGAGGRAPRRRRRVVRGGLGRQRPPVAGPAPAPPLGPKVHGSSALVAQRGNQAAPLRRRCANRRGGENGQRMDPVDPRPPRAPSPARGGPIRRARLRSTPDGIRTRVAG